ncbi:MAG: hypothetical protein ACI8QC_003271, partial [Planctomycetota bacterium]
MHIHPRRTALLLLGFLTGLQACSRSDSGRQEPRTVPDWYEVRTEDPLSAREIERPEPAQPADQPAQEPEQAPEQERQQAQAPLPKGKPEAFGDLPFTPPPIPAYRIPRSTDCDWILRDGIATSTRDLGEIRAADNDGYLIGPAYSASMQDRQENPGLSADRPVIFGVFGDGGGVVLGGGWSLHSPRTLFFKDRAGEFTDIRISI